VENALAAEQLRLAKDAAEQEVRQSRDRFEALAAERALLLREVNHRVSNSLQLISSMLQIQASAAERAETRDALLSAMTRVLAVAEVHRRLYTSDGVESVSLDQYLACLIDDLQRSSDDEGLAQLTLQAEPLEIDPDRAVAIGVVVNELVINAWKYAYPDVPGPIRIGLERGIGRQVMLFVEDEGIGTNTADPAASTGLGQKIVKAMAQKLGAEVRQDPKAAGTKVVLTFPLGASEDCPAA
jgi:two-component sensor histidine kinase